MKTKCASNLGVFEAEIWKELFQLRLGTKLGAILEA